MVALERARALVDIIARSFVYVRQRPQVFVPAQRIFRLAPQPRRLLEGDAHVLRHLPEGLSLGRSAVMSHPPNLRPSPNRIP